MIYDAIFFMQMIYKRGENDLFPCEVQMHGDIVSKAD